MVAAPAVGQMGQTVQAGRQAVEGVVDASGNLHVPSDYRAAYQFLGTWAVAADGGPGSKELHVQ